jgi:hypothetical protein
MEKLMNYPEYMTPEDIAQFEAEYLQWHQDQLLLPKVAVDDAQSEEIYSPYWGA